MADRSGFNKGSVLIDALRGEFLSYTLGISGSSANFALADDQRVTVLDAHSFPGNLNELKWRLKFDPIGNQTVRVTATDPQGNRLGAYQRDVSVAAADTQAIPVYTVGLLFVTAVGYTIQVVHTKQNGVVEQIVDVQFKNGQPTDRAAEPVGIDFA